MVKGEICFEAGILYLSDRIQEMIANGNNIREIEKEIDNLQNNIRKSQRKIIKTN